MVPNTPMSNSGYVSTFDLGEKFPTLRKWRRILKDVKSVLKRFKWLLDG